MDVSCISATYIIPRFPAVLRKGGHAVVLIKPQFEVGRQMLGKGGIVKDPKAHALAVQRVAESGMSVGLTPMGLIPSPIAGGDGNREFLIHFIYQTEEAARVDEDLIRRVTSPAH
jgi:23S rRNA (cytidine1920-2'-O)/16S rRNA (cytidine1409-2'-O)-methyltransferase